MLPKRGWLLAATLGFLGCATNPQRPTEVIIVRAVATLQFHPPTDSVIVVDVLYETTEPRLLEMERSEIHFEASSGDKETVLAPPNEYIVGMLPGRSVEDFRAMLTQLDARYTRSLLHQMFVTLVLGPYGRQQAEAVIAATPGVDYVEYSTRREIMGGPFPTPTHAFAAVTLGGSGAPGDHKLFVTSGDTVWARHAQPDGTLKSSFVVVP